MRAGAIGRDARTRDGAAERVPHTAAHRADKPAPHGDPPDRNRESRPAGHRRGYPVPRRELRCREHCPGGERSRPLYEDPIWECDLYSYEPRMPFPSPTRS